MVLENLNFLILVIISPILILVGIVGFITPDSKKIVSTETAYNIFIIASGVLGAVILLSNHDLVLKGFNVILGLTGLYQAVAARTRWFPWHYFRWTRVDIIINTVIGLLFLTAGLLGQ